MMSNPETFDLEIEGRILATLMHVGDVPLFLAKVPFLQSLHFYSEEHGKIFAEIRKMSQDGAVSSLSLSKALPALKNYIKDLVGLEAPWTLVNDSNCVLALFKTRQLFGFADFIKKEVSGEKNVNESLVLINSHFEDLFKKGFDLNIQNSKDLSLKIVEDLTAQHHINPTCLKCLDEAMGGGLYSGKSYAIAARKKTGKTLILSTISNNLNYQGVKHLFIAAEMSPTEIHQRNIARAINRNSLSFIGKAKSNPDFQQEVIDYWKQDPGNILYLGAPGITFDDLKMAIGSAILKYGIKGVILDYFQLVGGKSQRETQAQHFDDIAQWIADFCRKNDIWSLVAAQINQEGNIRGGEGIKLAFDQAYELKKSEKWTDQFYMVQTDTRYTPWCEIGTDDKPKLVLEKNGPYFRER